LIVENKELLIFLEKPSEKVDFFGIAFKSGVRFPFLKRLLKNIRQSLSFVFRFIREDSKVLDFE
jgi:hypothetical protein